MCPSVPLERDQRAHRHVDLAQLVGAAAVGQFDRLAERDPAGKIGWGAGNQLVRTRAAYARAGYVTLVPDIASDFKTSSFEGYRHSAPHGRDIGALIKHLRGLKAPVVLVATSRGAVSAGAALANTSGAERPDALVLTAAMLVSVGEKAPHFQMAIGHDPRRAQLPLLVVGHKKDGCMFTRPSTIDQFKAWHGGTLDVVLLDGPEGTGAACGAGSAHGFVDIDDEVVTTVTRWIVAQNLSGRLILQVGVRHEAEGLPSLLRADRRRAWRYGISRRRASDDLSATDAVHLRVLLRTRSKPDL